MPSPTPAPAELTINQRLADFCSDWELPKVLLRAHESVVGFRVADGLATVLIHRYSTTETRTQLRFVKSGHLFRTWAWQEEYWVEQPPIMLWDDTFVPHAADLYSARTERERQDSARWATLCARPGTERDPMHSFDRVAQCAPSLTTQRMARHWGLTLEGAA